MASGRRWTVMVDISDSMIGEYQLKFWSDDQEINAKDLLIDRGMAIGRLLPDAKILSSDVSLYCYTCGYDSDKFEDEHLPECECE
jgi:hypothetical protein